MKIPKIILSRPKLVVDIKCPKCRSMDIMALPFVEVTCKNCKTRFETHAEINILAATAKKYLQVRSNHNEIWVLGCRDDSDSFHADDMLRPRSAHEDAVYNTMLAYKELAEKEKCYIVSKITSEYDDDYRVLCNVCGVCQNCVTCIRCGQKYVPKEVSTPQGNENRYKCSKCGFWSYNKTFIPHIEGSKCPYCGSAHIKKTSFNSDKKQCPKCHTKNESVPGKVPVYKLVIKRQKRNEIKEEELK